MINNEVFFIYYTISPKYQFFDILNIKLFSLHSYS